MTHRLAQVNIALSVAAFDDPLMTPMIRRIAEINSLAERSTGFVWRLQTPAGDLSHLKPFDDGRGTFRPDRIFFNMSVWESLEDLKAYVFESEHVELYRRRREWLIESAKPGMALWWVASGRFPSVAEAKRRLDLIGREGPTVEGFNFSRCFAAPG